MTVDYEFVDARGHKTRAMRVGSGPSVVILHGWGGRIESMAPVVRCLRSDFHVTALDLPGFGDAPAPPGAWATPDYAEYVVDVLSALGVGRSHFVGHSFGAKTSLYIAATHRDLVDKVVVVGSPGIKSAPSLDVRLKRALSRGGRALELLGAPGRAAKEKLYGAIASGDYRDAGELRPILVRVVNEDLTDVIREVRAPVLLIWGEKDDAVPLDHARRMERLIPDAGLVVFEGAGHFAYLDDPGRFCRVVRHFFGASR